MTVIASFDYFWDFYDAFEALRIFFVDVASAFQVFAFPERFYAPS